MNLWLPCLLGQTTGSYNAALVTFIIYTLIVFALAILSNARQKSGGFLSEYFLGSRGLGVWAFALTFAATSASGGSFMGFPSKIYSHGWILALWIASYMLVPVMTMGLLGKRLNQFGRKTGAITIPDILRARFASRPLGVLATLLIIFFMAFNLVAQFKAGSVMLNTLADELPFFQTVSTLVGTLSQGRPLVGSVDPEYLVCLLFFSVAVIVYTSYGGFRAVVWTDVLQGVVMVCGVLILLPLALWQVGGLSHATDELAKMTPPLECDAELELLKSTSEATYLSFGTWISADVDSTATPSVFRTARRAQVDAGDRQVYYIDANGKRGSNIPLLRITTPEEIDRILKQKDLLPVSISQLTTKDYEYGANQPGVYVSGPGPSPTSGTGFLPISLAVSFFFFWIFAGSGQPSNMVRLMAFDSATTFRRAIVTVAIYYSMIYFPLVIIFCCARVVLPGMEIESDRIMPEMAEYLTMSAGWPWLAGMLVAAPFAAVMSTVDSFLLMISSAVVRDVYQREINPQAGENTLRRLTYVVTATVGIAALLGALNPPAYLQDIIVFTGGGLSGSFLIPVAFALYWPRFNAAGAIAGMLGGFLTHVALYGIGTFMYGRFDSVKIGNLDPFLPELLVSMLAAVIVTSITPRPSESLVKKFFYQS